MEYKTDAVLDIQGNAVFNASIRALTKSRQLATVYNASGVQIPNPVSTDKTGEYSLALPNGEYYLEVSFNGTVYETKGPVTFYDPKDERTNVLDFMTPEQKMNVFLRLGTVDVSSAIQTALNSGALKVLFSAGVYALSLPVVPATGQTIQGDGWPVITAISGSIAAPLLVNVNAKNDVKFSGFVFDGNTSNVTGFSNVFQTFNANRIEISGNRFRNCRGIAVLVSGGTYIEALGNEFDDCGLYHLTSGQNSDRKQAIAFSNASFVTADDNDFRNIGLDCISFTGGTDARATRNRIAINYAGTIYLSNMTRAVIEGNQISNGAGGGNGIDIISSKDITIGGNLCRGCGAAGILIAGNSTNISVNGNICSNNWKSGTSLHRGGITLAADTGQAMSGITLSANICYDDQGPGAVTQRYAIGVYANGGTFSRVMVDQSNSLTGYNSGGNADNTNVFQSTALGIVGYPLTFNLADQAEVVLYTATSLQGEFSVCQNNNGYYSRFFVRPTNAALRLQDVSTQFETTDTGTTQAVYRDSATNTVRLKNRTGAAKNYTVAPLSWAYNT